MVRGYHAVHRALRLDRLQATSLTIQVGVSVTLSSLWCLARGTTIIYSGTLRRHVPGDSVSAFLTSSWRNKQTPFCDLLLSCRVLSLTLITSISQHSWFIHGLCCIVYSVLRTQYPYCLANHQASSSGTNSCIILYELPNLFLIAALWLEALFICNLLPQMSNANNHFVLTGSPSSPNHHSINEWEI